MKPDFVAFGGNLAVSQLAGAAPRWISRDLHLGEPTTRLNTDGGRLLTAVSGTSFAAPHVGHAAARALATVPDESGRATAHAARALLGVAAETPPCGDDWLAVPIGDAAWSRLRLTGFGMVNVDRVCESLDNDVCLLASDQVAEDHWHLYELRVPPAFLAGRGERGIVVSLAYDPPVRSSRRDYLARTMWLEVLKGYTPDEIVRIRARRGPGGDPPSKTSRLKMVELMPARTALEWSTLQVRHKKWARVPRFPIAHDDDDPTLHLLVGCQSRFPHGEAPEQSYSVAVRFWHGGQYGELYQEILGRVRTRARILAPS